MRQTQKQHPDECTCKGYCTCKPGDCKCACGVCKDIRMGLRASRAGSKKLHSFCTDRDLPPYCMCGPDKCDCVCDSCVHAQLLPPAPSTKGAQLVGTSDPLATPATTKGSGQVGELYWHIHHDKLVERLAEPLERRIAYIKRSKPTTEQTIRLAVMTPVWGDLPPRVQNGEELLRLAREALDSLGDVTTKTGSRPYTAIDRISLLEKRIQSHMSVLEPAEFEALHKIEHPGCPWNGKTIFPVEQAAKATSGFPSTGKTRMRNGWTVDDFRPMKGDQVVCDRANEYHIFGPTCLNAARLAPPVSAAPTSTHS